MATLFDYKEPNVFVYNIYFEAKSSGRVFIRTHTQEPTKLVWLVDIQNGFRFSITEETLKSNYRPIPERTTFSVEV